MAKLVLADQTRVPLVGDMSFGRAPGSSVVLADPSVSRVHARISLSGNFPVNTGVSSGCGDPHIAVDNSAGGSAGNIYIVPSNTKIYGWGPTGAPNAPWTSGVDAGGETCGVAVTNTGEVWGGTYGGAKITKRYRIFDSTP